MSVRTDANVIGANPIDPGAGNTMITKGTSNLKTMKVTINGEQYFVQTRYDKGDGTTAAVVVARTEIERTTRTRGSRTTTRKDKVDTPWVLFTTDSEGNTTFGGEGRTDNPDNLVDVGPMHTTTEATAKAILATAQIDGSPATEAQVLAEHNVRTSTLHSNSRQIPDGPVNAGIPPVAGVTPIQATTTAGPIPLQVIPAPAHNQDTEPEDNLKNDGQEPEDFLGNLKQGADEAIDKAGSLLGTITEEVEKIANATVEQFKLSPEELREFEDAIAAGGGDPIKSAQYPYDNTFGELFGQDYVTIDQFTYQPPRRDQILGDKPLENIAYGNQRTTPLKKLIAQVKLPMPNSINDANKVSWGNGDAMSNITAAIVSGAMRNPAAVAAGGFGANFLGNLFGIEGLGPLGAMAGIGYNATESSGSGNIIQDAMNRIQQIIAANNTSGAKMLAKTSMQSAIVGMAGVNVSADSILSRGMGVVPNANLELLFDTPALRDFEFSWKMTPRDENEAKEVKKIIRFFKQGMAAKTLTNKAGGRALFLGSPNVFRLQYRTAGGEIIEGVNRIKPCAITGTAVNYTPDGVWSAYDQGQPVSTVLTISMMELEPVYASDYTEDNITAFRRSGSVAVNFAAGDGPLAPEVAGEGDLYSIRPSEVGY